MRNVLALIALLALAGSAAAQPAPGQGGSIPLGEVLDVAKPYPNLTTQVRLRLIASNTTKEKVTCSAQRFANTWAGLGGARIAPYICPIGKRTLTITAEPTYYDKAGYKLKQNDPALAAKAVKVVESRLKWSWK
jgi:hypothetical protein